MGPSKIRKAIGAVKDRTSISMAKVSNSHSMSDLEVAVLKATRHDEYPADERHVSEILSLTSYSRAFISYTVELISKRLSKTRNSTVALKTLVLAHRLLTNGDPTFQQEMFFATRRGTRLLNMSDFRDKSKSRAWDYSAFVRTYALYLDEQLEYRTQGRKGRSRSRSTVVSVSSVGEDAAPVDVEGDEGDHHHHHHHHHHEGEGEGEDDEYVAERSGSSTGSTAIATPVRGMKTERIFTKTMHLQQLLERFLACRPTGEAKANRIVLVSLYPVVRESFQLYYELTEIMGVLIDRFMEMDIEDCAKVHEIFARLSKQFEELNLFYNWCKSVGIARSSEYPEVERIPSKKLDLMDEFIHEKAALLRRKNDESSDQKLESTCKEEEDRSQEPVIEGEEKDDDMNAIKALPPPEGFDIDANSDDNNKDNIDQSNELVKGTKSSTQQEGDLLNLGEDALKSEEHGDRLALALFDGEASSTTTMTANDESTWVAFPSDDQDWESSLVQSASHLNKQKLALAGGFDMLLLDGMYKQPPVNITTAQTSNGSLSSVALGSAGTPGPMLALPAPPPKPGDGGSGVSVNGGDPFAASLGVAPPAYVQMSEMEKKQRLLVEEQVLWQQYARDGMKGNFGMPQNNSYGMGGYKKNYH
ncbi:hypothetical protein Sjap_018457 [Stephania japonica]|uniref:ENTH domain-containing protein n=1 Tax=Stephania japonica TaxID=461633 RepID=A0AAP0I847_9MAGN